MNRKEFLITLWKKAIKPIILLVVIVLCIRFLYNVFNESGTERFLVIFIFGYGALILIAYFLGIICKSILEKIKAILPKQVLFWFRLILKTLEIISPIIIGVLIYQLWVKDWILTAVLLGIMLVSRIKETINHKRQNGMNNIIDNKTE